MAALIILGVVAVAIAAFLLARRQSSPSPAAMPAGWTALTDGNDYGAKVDASGSFTFPLAPSSVHYVTKGCSGLSGTGIRLRYRIDGDPGVTFHDAQDGNQITVGPMLYFQRAGDDWSGAGQFEAYRWWCEGKADPLTPGDHEIIAKFSDRWTAVMSSNSDDNPEAFRAALSNAARVGFTFPNDTGAGHGITASGKATFTTLAFEII